MKSYDKSSIIATFQPIFAFSRQENLPYCGQCFRYIGTNPSTTPAFSSNSAYRCSKKCIKMYCSRRCQELDFNTGHGLVCPGIEFPMMKQFHDYAIRTNANFLIAQKLLSKILVIMMNCRCKSEDHLSIFLSYFPLTSKYISFILLNVNKSDFYTVEESWSLLYNALKYEKNISERILSKLTLEIWYSFILIINLYGNLLEIESPICKYIQQLPFKTMNEKNLAYKYYHDIIIEMKSMQYSKITLNESITDHSFLLLLSKDNYMNKDNNNNNINNNNEDYSNSNNINNQDIESNQDIDLIHLSQWASSTNDPTNPFLRDNLLLWCLLPVSLSNTNTLSHCCIPNTHIESYFLSEEEEEEKKKEMEGERDGDNTDDPHNCSSNSNKNSNSNSSNNCNNFSFEPCMLCPCTNLHQFSNKEKDMNVQIRLIALRNIAEEEQLSYAIIPHMNQSLSQRQASIAALVPYTKHILECICVRCIFERVASSPQPKYNHLEYGISALETYYNNRKLSNENIKKDKRYGNLLLGNITLNIEELNMQSSNSYDNNNSEENALKNRFDTNKNDSRLMMNSQIRWLAELNMQQDLFHAAWQLYDYLAQQPEADGDVHHGLGAALLEAGLWQAAHEAWCNGLQRHPNHILLKHQIDKYNSYPNFDMSSYVRSIPTDFRNETIQWIGAAVSPDRRISSSKSIFLTTTPLLSPHECKEAIRMAEAHIVSGAQWTTSRHYAVPTTDMPIHTIPPLLHWFNEMLTSKLVPLLACQFNGTRCKYTKDIQYITTINFILHTYASFFSSCSLLFIVYIDKQILGIILECMMHLL